MSIIDFINCSDEFKKVAKIEFAIRRMYGKSCYIIDIKLCRKCKIYGNVLVLDTRANQKFYIGISINNDVVNIKEANIMYGDLCYFCFREEIDKLVNETEHTLFGILMRSNMPLLPYKTYIRNNEYVIELPNKKLKFNNSMALNTHIKKYLKLIIERIFVKIATERNEHYLSPKSMKDIIKEFRKDVIDCDWRLLELRTIIEILNSEKNIKTVNNFEDVIALVAYIEKRKISELRNEYTKYGIILDRSRNVGFSRDNIARLDSKQLIRIFPTIKGDLIIHKDAKWRLNRVYLKYLKPLRYFKNDQNILKIETKCCKIYITPS